jgi:hypothetical protein
MTDLATVARVANRFALPVPARAVVPFGTGHINETFLVTTTRDEHERQHEYVVQRLNRAVFSEPATVIDNIARVSAHLEGRFVPEAVAARAGGWMVDDGGKRGARGTGWPTRRRSRPRRRSTRLPPAASSVAFIPPSRVWIRRSCRRPCPASMIRRAGWKCSARSWPPIRADERRA